MAKNTPDTKKNLGESIRQRLKNLAKEKQRPFDELLRYFAMERWLYRLSISPYFKNFFLKGGLMLRLWDEDSHRPTLDIDMLAKQISNEQDRLQQIIKDISALSYPEDGMSFDCDRLSIKETQAGGEYEGICASFHGSLHTARIPMRLDIGFNDIILPEPKTVQYPTLLSLASPKLQGYTHETFVAEKLESIIKLGIVNTRMKDFYDLWIISQQGTVSALDCKPIIEKVCLNRNTRLKHPIAFTELFYDDPKVQRSWKAFLGNMNCELVDFQTVIQDLEKYFNPVFKE